MTVDEATFLLHTLLQRKKLEHKLLNVHEIVFRDSWSGFSYAEIAEISNYDAEYIKYAGSKLWQLLSEAFDRRVSKSNFRSVFWYYNQELCCTSHQQDLAQA